MHVEDVLVCGPLTDCQHTPGHERKPWEDLDTTMPFPERITCLRERVGPTLPHLNLPSRDLDARQV